MPAELRIYHPGIKIRSGLRDLEPRCNKYLILNGRDDHDYHPVTKTGQVVGYLSLSLTQEELSWEVEIAVSEGTTIATVSSQLGCRKEGYVVKYSTIPGEPKYTINPEYVFAVAGIARLARLRHLI